jgi:tetratricopeptide (TPR) repeat protein
LGVIYARNMDFKAAISSLDNALKIDSNHFESLNNRSRIHQTMGDDSLALEDMTLLVERNPTLANAWSNKGHFYLGQRQYDPAIVYFSRAIELNPKDFRNYVNRGMCYGYEGEYEKEMANYSKSIEIRPNYLAYYNRGRIYLKRGDYKEAIIENDKVIDLNPEYAEAYLNKGNALFKMTRHKEAIECYQKGLTFNSNRDTKGKLQYQLKNATELLKK